MANFALCYDNQADTATLTAGTWTAGLPRDNLKDYRLTRKARTTDATTANTVVRFALASASYIQALSLAATNASTSATYRYRLFSDAGFITQIYDSGTLTLFPSGSMPNTQIPAGAPNAGTGKPLRAQIQRFQCNINHLLTSPQYTQYGELAITDTTNPDGYFEAGRLFVGRVLQPATNPDTGTVRRMLTSRSEVTRARDGTPYFLAFRPDFAIPLGLKGMTQDEAAQALEMQRIVDVYGDVLVIEDAADSTYWWMRQLYGQLKQLDPIEFPDYTQYATSFQVQGTL